MHTCKSIVQGVVTYTSRVEAFATKIKPSVQSLFESQSRDESKLRTANESKTCGCNLTFDPLKTKWSRASEGNDQEIKHTLLIKNLDLGHKHFNRWHISDYPWIWESECVALQEMQLWCKTVSPDWPYFDKDVQFSESQIINPRCACAARVIVLCVSICRFVCYN